VRYRDLRGADYQGLRTITGDSGREGRFLPTKESLQVVGQYGGGRDVAATICLVGVAVIMYPLRGGWLRASAGAPQG
jgi:hypothetical protein